MYIEIKMICILNWFVNYKIKYQPKVIKLLSDSDGAERKKLVSTSVEAD